MDIKLTDIEKALEDEHTLHSFFAMMQRKQVAWENKRHWFVIKDGKNVCDFCGILYNISLPDTFCNASVPE